MIRIKWFPPSWVQITHNNSVLYIDPAYLKTYYKKHPTKIEYSTWPDEIDGLPEELPIADGILLTHGHKDHCKRVTINRLSDSDTMIFGPKKCLSEVGKDLQIVKAGEKIRIKDFQITAVPAYNTPEGSSEKKVHKKGSCLGYKITVDNKSIYHPGDTSFIPEMKGLGIIDVAFIPIDGMFTMVIEEAVQATLTISPEIAIPVHDMGKNDPNVFRKETESKSDIRVKILSIGESFEI